MDICSQQALQVRRDKSVLTVKLNKLNNFMFIVWAGLGLDDYLSDKAKEMRDKTR